MITTAEELMAKADAKYMELKDMGTWSKRGVKDEQIIALTTQVKALQEQKKLHQPNKSQPNEDKIKSQIPKWKYDKSLSTSNELKRNGKIYKWCTGPGHEGKGMWVIHDPGSCTKNKSFSNDASKKGNSNPKAAFMAHMKQNGASDEEIESKLEAIMAVIES